MRDCASNPYLYFDSPSESALRSAPHKSAMAVGSVVLFGTLSMFLYPLAINAGWLHLDTMGAGLLLVSNQYSSGWRQTIGYG